MAINYSCTFECGLLKSLRPDCQRSCPSVVLSCTMANEQISNRSASFFPACQDWCCSETNRLAIAMFSVLGTTALLFMVLLVIIFRKCRNKRMREQLMSKSQWRPPTRDAFAIMDDEGDEGEGAKNHPAAGQQYQGRLGDAEGTGAAFQYRAGGENPYLVGGVVERLGGGLAEPAEPLPGFSRAPQNESRRSFMYDGEISLGFADEDFMMVEAERADGVSMAGSHMSRRSSNRHGVVMPMAMVRDPSAAASTVSSQQLSPRSDAGYDAPERTSDLVIERSYLSSVDHRGRPLSASKMKAQQQQQGTPPPSAGVSPRPSSSQQQQHNNATTLSAYVGLGKTPTTRPLSGSVRRQSSAAVTWDIFDDIDTVELERARSMRGQAPATSNQHDPSNYSSEHASLQEGAPPAKELPVAQGKHQPPSLLSPQSSALFGSHPPPPLPPLPPPAVLSSPPSTNLNRRGSFSHSDSSSNLRRAGSSTRRPSGPPVSTEYLWDADIESDVFEI